MSFEPVRFLHASDLHLEQPPYGLAEIPEHLRSRLIEAPYSAATRLFDAAIAEKVDFVILAGDVLDLHAAGARGLLFLADQFARLAERHIDVYWAPGEVDLPERWPAATVPLPANVHVFSATQPDDWLHRRKGRPVARILDAGRWAKRDWRLETLTHDGQEICTVVAAHAAGDGFDWSSPHVDYWALGGRHERATPVAAPKVVHFSGSPQARHPEETGPHGCTLVQIDVAGRPHCTFLPLDSVRFCSEELVVTESLTREPLWQQARARLGELAGESSGVALLVQWIIRGSGMLFSQLRRGNAAAELLEDLRREFGYGERLVWTTSLQCRPDERLPEALYEQETMLGDYLRTVRSHEQSREPIELAGYVDERSAGGPLAPAFRLTKAPARQRVLREAAALGVDLLSGDRP